MRPACTAATRAGGPGLSPDRTGGVSAVPTQEKPLTEAGSLLGTFQYMAPEQLEGQDADARADTLGLGLCLV